MLFMGTQLTLPYTLSVFMVRDFYQDKGGSEQLIAQLTGLLAATQSFARSLTSLPWGILSDIVGRKVNIFQDHFCTGSKPLVFARVCRCSHLWRDSLNPCQLLSASPRITTSARR